MTIGIFDSGLGGLTVCRALRRALPSADLIYFGDTARVPYGCKSAAAITQYSLEISDFLLSQGVELIVVACNTASAWALDTLQKTLAVPVIGVIEAGVNSLLEASSTQRVAIMGTRGTIDSGRYQEQVFAKCPEVQLTARACPLLVPLVEEQWLDHLVTEKVIGEYVGDLAQEGVDAVLLACTHYPLLYGAIQRVLGPQVQIVDSARAVALHLEQNFGHRLSGNGSVIAYVSDDPKHFARGAEPFFGEKIETRAISLS